MAEAKSYDQPMSETALYPRYAEPRLVEGLAYDGEISASFRDCMSAVPLWALWEML